MVINVSIAVAVMQIENFDVLTLSDFCTDKSVRKWRPAVTFVRIYPYTDFAIEMGRFKRRRLKTTLRYL